MKRLWKKIPPCLSDVMGFQAVMTQTDGLGIIDDPGNYKPLSFSGVGRGEGERNGRGGSFERGHGGPGRDEFGGLGEGGRNGRGGKGEGGRPGIYMPQITDSGLRNADIISGTEKKIIQAYESRKENNPSFVLISNAPSSAMISSDTDTAAIRISEDGTPAAAVKIYGDKDYLYGISMTFEAIAKLLLKPGNKKPNTVNILGCNCVDWDPAAAANVENLLTENGIDLICKWGDAGMTKEAICRSTDAALNIVVNVSGMRAAIYMEREFGIPYITGAPFGKAQTKQLIDTAKAYLAEDFSASPFIGVDKEKENNQESEVLVIGEQFTCNAIRDILRSKGYDKIRVISFFEMDKANMEAGDKKVISEDELADMISASEVNLVFGNPDYKGVTKKEVKWINLPNSGMSVFTKVNSVDMTGEKLDMWIESQIG